ncbi:MAG: diaminopimelate epimerase [Bacteroidaceae bacterium]|nr:diaminopimelate epimerase [Bacteroidaceae bacterium]
MTRKVRFTKMQGVGNDYIYVNTLLNKVSDPSEAARLWSSPHTGIGSDGLVLIGAATESGADFSMRIFNADGSEATMCGNASRCVGKYLYERGLTNRTEIGLQTLSDVKKLRLQVENGTVESVSVDMLVPRLADDKLFCPAPGLPDGTFVWVGNPHYVIFTDDVDGVEDDGPLLECHPSFPQRSNIEFAYVLPDGRILMRVWERGSGVTRACGTGACATAVAAVLKGLVGRQTEVVMDGGTLSIDWHEADNHVWQTGPAEFVFDGEIDDV